jgi:hypothetical protein
MLSSNLTLPNTEFISFTCKLPTTFLPLPTIRHQIPSFFYPIPIQSVTLPFILPPKFLWHPILPIPNCSVLVQTPMVSNLYYDKRPHTDLPATILAPIHTPHILFQKSDPSFSLFNCINGSPFPVRAHKVFQHLCLP